MRLFIRVFRPTNDWRRRSARRREKQTHRHMSLRDATEDGFKYVFAILRSLYPCVQTLEEFADGLVFSDGRKPVLLEEKDGARFQKLTRGLIICACTPPQQLRVPAQVPHTPVWVLLILYHSISVLLTEIALSWFINSLYICHNWQSLIRKCNVTACFILMLCFLHFAYGTMVFFYVPWSTMVLLYMYYMCCLQFF